MDDSARRRMAVVTLMLVAALGGSACTTGPAEVSLQVLAAEQEAFDGKVVATEGLVVPIEDRPGSPPYYVLEDNAGNRTRLHPDSVAQEHVNASVAVTGEFRFTEEAGRELHIDTITASG